jgi:hypothetical protein
MARFSCLECRAEEADYRFGLHYYVCRSCLDKRIADRILDMFVDGRLLKDGERLVNRETIFTDAVPAIRKQFVADIGAVLIGEE